MRRRVYKYQNFSILALCNDHLVFPSLLLSWQDDPALMTNVLGSSGSQQHPDSVNRIYEENLFK